MFPTGSRAARRRRRARHHRGDRLRRHPGGVARHRRPDQRRARAWRSWPASTCTPATPTCRRWTRRRSPSRPPPPRCRARASGRSSPPSAGCSSSSGWSPTRSCFIFGIIALIAAAAEWMVQAWSERASADVAFNADVRGRIAHPLEFPILGAVGVGIVIYSFSRIMLFLSKTSGPAVFAMIAAAILRRRLRRRLPPVAPRRGRRRRGGHRRGRAGRRRRRRGARGRARAAPPRDDRGPGRRGRVRHRRGDRGRRARLADGRRQGQPHRRGDAATRTARSIAKNLGVTGDQDTVVVTRSNPTNVLFRNESSEERRLVLDLGTRPEIDEEGEEIADTEMPNQHARSSSRKAAAS